MRRRTVLVGVTGALFGVGGGCLTMGADETARVRAKRPSESAGDGETHVCTLSEAFVTNHQPLERVASATVENAPRGEWVTEDVTREAGDALADDLREHCDATEGPYRYQDTTLVVEVRVLDDDGNVGDPLFPVNVTRSEAIRGGRTQEDA
ncbi:hypothetical protein PNP85_13185 [Halobacterium salinarum]|uniref:hypothetical protein n=1 Tax=Halobacterium TaxID=2239 RepID=UPI0019648518|nr:MULTISPECIES: hypothetical protein [Halobacterium]MCF2164488.1 hypothetical protein [Halobacterium salinarum]MCF2167275.1 hypothetical protein [Halobacterium salinarum]MCF2206255.1 hypothetical protein [Halobacterium salinarum]MCF2239721.1 hypothetical protein [Halobacterium salinarum]MCF2240317.1 hypothetical protein [Halobacterium salinarum]